MILSEGYSIPKFNSLSPDNPASTSQNNVKKSSISYV